MPELPEVETVVRGLRPNLIGHRIESMWYDWERTIATPLPSEMADRIVGQTITSIHRRAKYIICTLERNEYLIVHLKMTGRLYMSADADTHYADKWVHFRLQLDRGQQLRFSDSRKFGKVYFTDNLATIIGKLGPEPLEDSTTLAVFQERLQKRSKVIKALLLDQTFIAGVGNIYADESLHRAGIHPKRRSDSLNKKEIAKLYTEVRTALQKGIDHEGASINWYRKPDGSKGSSQDHFFAYGRTDQPCTTCGTSIEKITVAQRGTHFCPRCQKAPSK